MKYFIVVWVILILIGLFYISLDNLAGYGVNGLLIAGISCFVLYRIFKFMYNDYKAGATQSKQPRGDAPAHGRDQRPCVSQACDPLGYIFYGDIPDEAPEDSHSFEEHIEIQGGRHRIE